MLGLKIKMDRISSNGLLDHFFLEPMFKEENYTKKHIRWKLNKELLEDDDGLISLTEGVEIVEQDLEAGWNIRKALNKFFKSANKCYKIYRVPRS
uniref:Uncharacterized protein n=1 Tax=Lepeophtheirus salmonis TaxID=72036 RepID=A0A0K2VA25_LEPSM